LAITGGGFDTLQLRDGAFDGISVGQTEDAVGPVYAENALAIDKIYATQQADATQADVPEPSSLLLVATGMLVFLPFRRGKEHLPGCRKSWTTV
jgi:hypothetical protein